MDNDDGRDPEEDPFEVLLDNVTKILGVLEQSEERAGVVAAKRRWQVRRVKSALRALKPGDGGETAGVAPARSQAQLDGARRATETRRRNRETRDGDREEATVG